MTPLKSGLVAAGAVVCASGALYLAPGLRLRAEPARLQNQESAVRTVKLTARRYRFDPPRIEVQVGDLVSVELHTEDIAHSLTIDGYRIAKRVGPARPVTFEFRADQAGTFPFYCSLQIEDGCRQMRGELVVKGK